MHGFFSLPRQENFRQKVNPITSLSEHKIRWIFRKLFIFLGFSFLFTDLISITSIQSLMQ